MVACHPSISNFKRRKTRQFSNTYDRQGTSKTSYFDNLSANGVCQSIGYLLGEFVEGSPERSRRG